jgi:hypothetical protein
MEEGMLRCGRFLLALAFVIASSGVLAAQGTDSAPSQSDQPLLKPEQLDALVAPIALYPDALLANMLAASTYPLEVVEADRWAAAHKKLNGDQLKAEVDKQSWDDSVKALSTTPTVLAMMSEKLDWTKSLGDAVLAQQPDVMDAIQRLRSRAQANNKLSSTKEQKVSVQQQEGKQAIVIEPTDPNMMYVPYYEPAVVYGDWPYPDYPPYYFGAPPYIGAGVIAAGIAFGAGFALGAADAIGATTISLLTARTTLAITGSTIRCIARVCDTTTPVFSRSSEIMACGLEAQAGRISAVVTGSRCCVRTRVQAIAPEIVVTAAVIVQGIAAVIAPARVTGPAAASARVLRIVPGAAVTVPAQSLAAIARRLPTERPTSIAAVEATAAAA